MAAWPNHLKRLKSPVDRAELTEKKSSDCDNRMAELDGKAELSCPQGGIDWKEIF